MSETQKLKLNLKALQPLEEKKQIKETQETTDIGSGDISETIQQDAVKKDDVIETPLPKEEKDSSESPKAHRISFSDIRKDIPESSEGKKEEADIISEEKQQDEKENKSAVETAIIDELVDEEKEEVENKSVEIEAKEDISTAVEEAEEKKKSKKDKVALENQNKAKNIISSQELSKKNKKGFFSFLKKKGKKVTEETQKEDKALKNNKNISEEAVTEEIHFDNYESHFKKESSNILNRFRKFKYAPKTRVGLLLGLISLSTCSIGSLMVFFPDNHSPEIYKASILQIINKDSDSQIENTPTIIPEQESVKDTEVIKFEEEEEEREAISEIKKQQESKEKLKQHLLDKYSS